MGAKFKNCKPLQLQIKYGGHAYLMKNGTVSIDVIFSSGIEVRVEQLFLEFGSKRFQPVSWAPFMLKKSLHLFSVFDLNRVLGTMPEDKLKVAILVASTGGIEHRSPDFDISSLIQ